METRHNHRAKNHQNRTIGRLFRSGMVRSFLKWRKETLPRLSLALAGSALVFMATIPPAQAKTGTDLDQRLQKNAQLPKGYRISLFAGGMKRARLIVETATGDFIVSSFGPKVFLLSADRNGDGRADGVRTLLGGLNIAHGILLDEGWLYVAEQHRVFRVRFDAQKGAVHGKRETIVKGMPNTGGHVTRTLKKGPDGWFYVSVGSSCNVCRETHPWRATILRFHPDKGKKPQIFATGLRNTVGFDWHPQTGKLYGVDNGRDWLGDNFPPDELNLIEPGKFYGWPYRNGDNVPDPDLGKRFTGKAEKPVFAIAAHTAPLSIRFLRHQKPADMQNVALIAQHGSWNRSTKDGYRLISLHFGKDGTIKRKVFLGGFLRGQKVIGRPVDILERKDGSLLVSDDFNGTIWRITYSDPKAE